MVSRRVENMRWEKGKESEWKNASRKMWDHVIKLKKRFVLRKGKIYTLSRKEKEEIYEFI